MPAQTTIQVRRGTASSWTSTNPTLAAGEVGFETDTGKFKIGTGSTVWTGLAYSSILPNTVTTKGDLLAATGSATVDRLAAGANGYTLVADSSTSTGLAYAGTTQGNPVLNSAFQIWQRGTSFSTSTGATAYTADRWNVRTNALNLANTVSRQTTSDTTNLPNIQYCARVQRNSGQTGTDYVIFEQSWETVNSIPYVGKTVTLSFYARKGANFSSTSDILIASITNGTGTDQQVGSYTGYNGQTQNNTLTTTWQRFSLTKTIPTNATEIALQFYYNPTGTAGAADYFEITGVQIDLGSTALPFRTYANTIQGELAACQRYYTLWASGSAQPIGMGTYLNGTQVNGTVALPVEMRTAPTISQVTGTNYYRASSAGGGSDDFNSLTLDTCSTRAVRYYNASEAAGTAGQAAVITTNNAASFLAFQAEL